MSILNPAISVIVPTWRADRDHLGDLLPHLAVEEGVEVVVAVPEGEAHEYAAVAGRFPAAAWASSAPGRGRQMNAGAAIARGRWLLFLHVDSRLSPSWPAAIARAEAAPRVVAGSYRLRLASRDPRARLIEAGVRIRVRLLGLPYGDQGLFVRRDVFDALGGYRDLPLMEDVDLVRRLKRVGRLWHDPLPVVTSARRWERDGWVRRSLTNVCLATLFRLGVAPRTLARIYLRRPAVAVAMLARAPWVPGKTRLTGHLPPADQDALREAIFADTLDAVRSLPGPRAVVVFCEPPGALERLSASLGQGVEVMPQRAGDLGERIHGAFDDLFRLGAASAIVVGSDLPDLPGSTLAAARQLLRIPGDRVVLGPATDGGYYLVGLKAPHPELFAPAAWGTSTVLEETLRRARASGLETRLLPPWHDLDEWSDLERLAASPASAPRTRAWCAARRPGVRS